MDTPVLLVGDIGGTKVRLRAYLRKQGGFTSLAEEQYPSRKYACLEDIVNAFVKKYALNPEQGFFGVAGPVTKNTAVITNLPWVIQAENLQRVIGMHRVVLLNDVEAMAYAIPALQGGDRELVRPGKEKPQGGMALIAPGTGLGMAFLTWDGRRYQAHASEGGHIEFAPRNDMETELLRYLWAKYDHVSYERVCSGKGMVNLYAFLRDIGRFIEPEGLRQALAAAEDPTRVIMDAALRELERDPGCAAVLDLFTSILAAQAGNFALTVSCDGGFYIGGGIPPRMTAYFKTEQFAATFMDKGRLSSTLRDVPIYVITHPEPVLLGAYSYATAS